MRSLTVYFLTLLLVVPGLISYGQVTTSSITGTVKDNNNQPLVGATIVAVHTPSGTTYHTIARTDGVFSLPGLRIGGPYKVTVSYAGLKQQEFDNITLQLGEPYNINATLGNEKTLENVVITARGGRRAATDKTGMATNISNRQITSLPTITRSITDFTRLSPQSNGTNFGGRDARYNNISVDGANLNNNFGLSTDPLPGGGNNPISIDAIDEIAVSLAPYDVRQGNFTGANINATTKSGTNTFHGTAYTFYQNQNFNGTNVAGTKIAGVPKQKHTIYGGSLGGPIIKNKLFFFVNGEYEEKSSPGITWTPRGGSGANNISDVPVDSMIAVSNYLQSKFGFNPGSYDNFPNFSNKNHKLLGKIDWNISNEHKLTLKYSDFSGTQDFLPSQSGGINGASSQGNIVTYGPKFSKMAMGFSNITFIQKDIVRSGSLELNSNFHGKFANQLLATITKTSSDKSHNGATFPFVDILGATPGNKNNFISLGNEPFNGNNNSVINDIYIATDNFTYFAGRHTLTAGVSYEFQKVGNMFMAGSQGYYVFGSVNDFINNRAPKLFSITYSLLPGQDAVYSANLKIGQLAWYGQDEFVVNPKVKITAGIRFDKPVYPEQPLENPGISALNLYKTYGDTVTTTHYTTGHWPQPRVLASPRVGVRWDVKGDKTTIIRGGTGIFTGRIPFVYLTNIPSNSGMYQVGTLITSNLQNYLFNPDPHAYNPFYNKTLDPKLFPTTAGTVSTAPYALTASNFKFPQIWRTNLAIEQVVAKSWHVSVEALYTKDINAVYMFNANQRVPNGIVTTGPVSRPYYTSSAARKLNQNSGNAIVLANTSKGNSFILTAQVSKFFPFGLSGSIAYTYNNAKDVTANPGSQANSVWSVNATSNTQNDLELAYSNFAVPHRVVGWVTYRKEYLNHLGTSVSLFYEGKSAGTYSYIYNGDLNNDGNSADLMYIPKDPSEIQFKNNVTYQNGITYTSQQQSDIFFKYIDQDPYLRKHKGEVAKRNGAKFPWYDRVDMKIAQDIFNNFGGDRHTLQITADFYNILNLVNHNWGILKLTTVMNPLKVESVTNGVPTFSITPYNGAPVTQTFVNNISTSTTWTVQLGLRYMF
jgi:hypothetical protein